MTKKIPHNKFKKEEVIRVIKEKGYYLDEENFEYYNDRQKITIWDNIGYKYYVSYRSILIDTEPRMTAKNNPYSIDNIKLYLQINNINIILISDIYESNKQKLEFICECGEHYFAEWSKIQQGFKTSCRKCSYDKRVENNSYTIEDINNYIKSNDLGITLLSKEYNGIKDILHFKCECGEEFYTSFDKLKGRGKVKCSKCSHSKSKYCVILEKYLKDNNISYATEVSFIGCINPQTSHKLFFDYAIYINNELFLIEVDGEQHYKSVEAFGGEKAFAQRQMLDGIKDKYCEENNIKLIRIPYWEFDKKDTFKEKLLHIIDTN